MGWGLCPFFGETEIIHIPPRGARGVKKSMEEGGVEGKQQHCEKETDLKKTSDLRDEGCSNVKEKRKKKRTQL